MWFMLVNGRTPKPQAYCAFCTEPIGASYLREIGTRIAYCCVEHYAAHCLSAAECIEHKSAS